MMAAQALAEKLYDAWVHSEPWRGIDAPPPLFPTRRWLELSPATRDRWVQVAETALSEVVAGV